MAELKVEDIEVFYNRYGASVLYRCRQLLRDEQAAWDAMHQTFVKAIKYRKSFKGDSAPRTWLYSIATRVCLDEIQRAKGRAEMRDLPEAPEVPDGELTERPLERRLQDQQTVARLLSFFSEKVQQIVVLRYFDELEVKEISKRTGLSERTVARRLSEFLERSRRLLADVSA